MLKIKLVVALLLMSFLALNRAASAVADNYTIIRGRSIGKVRIGATRTAILRILGKPSKSVKWRSGPIQDSYRGPTPPLDRYGQVSSLPTFLNVIYRNNKVVQIEVSSPKFKTNSGISVRSSLAQFRAKYGKTRVRAYGYEDSNGGGNIGYYYDAVNKGIAFEFGVQDQFDALSTADSLRVHAPGLAVLPDPGGDQVEAKDEIPVGTIGQ